MKRGIFTRIFILYGIILLLAVLGAELSLTGVVRESKIALLRDNLAVQAALIGRVVPFRTAQDLDLFCREVKEAANARVTVIAPDGAVLGDSDHDSAGMENHSDRLEVQQAMLAGTGMAIRHSETLDANLLYVARKIGKDTSPSGYVRLSIPLTSAESMVNALRIKIILIVSAILIAAGGFSFWQIDRLRRLTLQIRDFAGSVAGGGLGKRLFLGKSGEFDEIAESLNTMSSELQQVLAASEEEKRRLNVILRNIPEALLITDTKGTIQLSNAASRIYFGEAALPGNLLVESIRNREFLALLDTVRATTVAGTAEFSIERPEARHFSVRIAPLFYHENELSGFVAVFHELTKLKQLERVRQDFVANISHELKTPITAIRGFAETLLDGALEDREHSRKFLETIRENSDRINSLVDDLMIISKIELGVIKLLKRPVDFGDMTDSVMNLFQDKARSKGLELTAIAPEGGVMLQADRDRLVQILTNLVDNAIKFTEQGSVTFGLREEGGRTVLFVEDTGIGVPDKHLYRLGERFYRVDTGRSRAMGGTGLGLAIVKHLVKAHGWEMEIKSIVGEGTTVRIFVA